MYKRTIHRERQVPYDFTHTWNLMNKITDKIETDPQIENTLTAVRGDGGCRAG